MKRKRKSNTEVRGLPTNNVYDLGISTERKGRVRHQKLSRSTLHFRDEENEEILTCIWSVAKTAFAYYGFMITSHAFSSFGRQDLSSVFLLSLTLE